MTPPGSTGPRLLTRLAAVVLVTATLYFGKGLFMPFALAGLLTFLLAPIVDGLERWHIRRGIAAVLTVLLASAGIFTLGWAVYGQLDDLGNSLPRYQENLRRKIAPLRGDSAVEKIQRQMAEAVDDRPAADQPATDPPAEAGPAAGGPAGARAGPTNPPGAVAPPAPPAPLTVAIAAPPMQVSVVPGVPTPFQFLGGLLGPLVAPLSLFGIVFVLVLFFLVYAEDVRNRFIRMLSPDRIALTTNALAEASRRTSRYLLMTLIINATYGVPVGIGLYLLGVPNALLWGLFATLLRFIPYLGPCIAAAFPIALSIAITPDWTLTAGVVGLFVVLELVSNNLVEPILYGRNTGLSPLAVLAAAIFWTWLWGIPGLFLSVPLTLCLVVLGRHIPQLELLSVLLGDEPSLAPGERFYQRLVALDATEATRIVDEHLRDHDLVALYDEVLLPALGTARRDTAKGHLVPSAIQYVHDTTRELLEELAEEPHALRSATSPASRMEALGAGAAPVVEITSTLAVPSLRVGFLPAGDATDALTGPILADVLRRAGLGFELFAGNATGAELRTWVGKSGARVVCIGGFAPYAVIRARHLYKRLRAAVPDMRILVTLWGSEGARPETLAQLRVSAPDRVATTMWEALVAIRALTAEGEGVHGTSGGGDVAASPAIAPAAA